MGAPMTRPKTVTPDNRLIHIRLSVVTHRELKTLTASTGSTIQELVSKLIESHIAKGRKSRTQGPDAKNI